MPIPWKLIGYVAAAAVVMTILWWTQSRIRVSYQAELERDNERAEYVAYRDAVQASAAIAAGKLERDQHDDAEHGARITELQNANAELSRILAGTPASVEVVDDQGNHRVAINAPWWLCNSARFTRDAADVVACKASPGNGEAERRGPGAGLQVPPGVQEPAPR